MNVYQIDNSKLVQTKTIPDGQSLNSGKLKVNKPNNRGKENRLSLVVFNPGFLV